MYLKSDRIKNKNVKNSPFSWYDPLKMTKKTLK